LGNAVKYVPAGRGEIEVSGTSESGSVLLRVRDNGIGIAQAYHRGIFELFGRVPEQEQTVDGERVGGTGVGLAIVKRIVEAHRGSVTVVSTPGAGSDFEVRMPGGGA
jgi:signal transduction histidine kinase